MWEELLAISLRDTRSMHNYPPGLPSNAFDDSPRYVERPCGKFVKPQVEDAIGDRMCCPYHAYDDGQISVREFRILSRMDEEENDV